ncbi:hypothetical protein HC174_01525 [Salinimicrobium sp. CDJ15-81-2]|nr:hypothetical protein [Salinimicrobium nanhaiense]
MQNSFLFGENGEWNGRKSYVTVGKVKTTLDGNPKNNLLWTLGDIGVGTLGFAVGTL